MAHYRRLHSGKWQAIVTLPNGRQMSRSSPVKRVVTEWAREVERDRDRGLGINPRAGKVLVDEWARTFLDARVVEDRTLVRYETLWDQRIKPHWGKTPLGTITKVQVESWVKRLLADKVGVRTVQQSLALFSAILSGAVEERLIPANPAAGIKKPRTATKPPRFLARKTEAPALLAKLSGDDRVFVDLLLHTGLRWGEGAGLKGSSLDFVQKQIHVIGVRTTDGKWKKYPKSRRSRRTVPMPKHLVGHLEELVSRSGADRAVFTAPEGGPLNYATWRNRVFKPAVRAAELQGVTPHTTRHTTASWLVQAGVSLYQVQQLLGHESPMTTQRYAHLAPDAFDAVSSVLDRDEESQRLETQAS